jgi:hypothetical protein
MARVFVIRPFGRKKDSAGREIDFELVHGTLIGPALEANELSGETTGEIVDSGNIREDMFRLLLEADVVICDITVHNANVFYELGIRHALRKKVTVLIKGAPTEDKTPFDLLTDRYFEYQIDDPQGGATELATRIRQSMAAHRPTDSPIFQMVPGLPEADPEKVQVVPPDFREEVARATVAKSKGWLRLLASEVRGLRFERSGLKLVGQAQWKLKDYDGAAQAWERIRAVYPDDVDANLALANIRERQSRDTRSDEERAKLLAASDDAINRVLANPAVERQERAEALALKGRNQKTHWRLTFAACASVADRRRAGLNRALVESFESYLDAYREDLSHFYPGLAALQMGSILQSLSGEAGWSDAFPSDRAARTFRDELEETMPGLSAAVSFAVATARAKLDPSHPDFRWAAISEADVLFLTSTNDGRVVRAYEHAFDRASPFDWDATRGQLQLFAELDMRADRATAVMTAVERVLGEKPKSRSSHVIVFAGHQVDDPSRAERRFPADREAEARNLIKARMQQLAGTADDLVLLGSASPGADILWHEACAELGLKTRICLPMPPVDHARGVFGSLDAWRARFLDLVSDAAQREVLVLSDCAGLPRWLEGTGRDPWIRGNEWVMKMASAWGAGKVTLVAFWDGRQPAAGSSGTAQAVQLARNEGSFRIEHIDSTALLVAGGVTAPADPA